MTRLVGLIGRAPKPLAALILAVVLTGSVLAGIVLLNDDGRGDNRHVLVGTPSTTTTVPPDAVPKVEAGANSTVGPPVTGPSTEVAASTATPTSSTKPTKPTKPTTKTGPSTTNGPTTTGNDAANPTTTTTTTTTPTTTPTTDPDPDPGPDPGPATDPDPDPEPAVSYPSGPGEVIASDTLYVVGVDDGQAHSVYHDEFLLDRQEWSADGRRVLVSLDNDTHDVFSMNLDGTGKTRVGSSTFEPATWSSQGDLAVIEYDGVGHELVITKTSGDVIRIAHEDVGPVSGRAWAPDGTKIAFIADARVWTATSDGADVTPITPAGGTAWKWLRWSPDGTKIAFQASERLFVVNEDGSGLRDLAPVSADPSFDWSPDSTKLAVCAPFQPSETRLAMSIVPIDGSPPMPLGAQCFEVAWAPDGSTIAYKSYPFTDSTIPLAVINPDGTGKRVLVKPPPGIFFVPGLDWSPDSTHLLVNTGESGPGGVVQP